MENLNLDKDSLEKALSSADSDNQAAPVEATPEAQPQIPKEEEIGFHKGALNTLVAERNELVKMIGNIEAIMQAHLKRLQELGVKIDTQAPASGNEERK
jgi:hypothetical protein